MFKDLCNKYNLNVKIVDTIIGELEEVSYEEEDGSISTYYDFIGDGGLIPILDITQEEIEENIPKLNLRLLSSAVYYNNGNNKSNKAFHLCNGVVQLSGWEDYISSLPSRYRRQVNQIEELSIKDVVRAREEDIPFAFDYIEKTYEDFQHLYAKRYFLYTIANLGNIMIKFDYGYITFAVREINGEIEYLFTCLHAERNYAKNIMKSAIHYLCDIYGKGVMNINSVYNLDDADSNQYKRRFCNKQVLHPVYAIAKEAQAPYYNIDKKDWVYICTECKKETIESVVCKECKEVLTDSVLKEVEIPKKSLNFLDN